MKNLNLDIKPVLTFETSKGSRYWVDAEGKTQRLKSYHPEHGIEDQGMKGVYPHCIYVDSDDAYKLAVVTSTRPIWLFLMDGKVGFVSMKEAITQLEVICGPFNYEQEPRVGLSPIEIQELKQHKGTGADVVQGKYHIGNKIVDVKWLARINEDVVLCDGCFRKDAATQRLFIKGGDMKNLDLCDSCAKEHDAEGSTYFTKA